MKGLHLVQLTTLLALCIHLVATSGDNAVRFLGVAVSEALPTSDPKDAFSTIFVLGPLDNVISLLGLSSEEVATLQQGFIGYLKDDLGITADAEVLAGLNNTQTVQVSLQISEYDGSGPSVLFLAAPASNAQPTATISPYFRSITNLQSAVYPFTGNTTIDDDTYELKEGGYIMSLLTDLALNSTVGILPANTFLSFSIMTWKGDSTGLAYRITSKRAIPIPTSEGILYTVDGYPGSGYLDLAPGELQAAYTFVPASGDSSALIATWTTTEGHPTFQV